MIVDVHTHAPRHKVAPEVTESKLSGLWRPDQKASTAHTWDDYIKGLEPVDRAIVFNIAIDPRDGVAEDGQLIYATPQVNDDTHEIAKAYPEKLIGFGTVHP